MRPSRYVAVAGASACVAALYPLVLGSGTAAWVVWGVCAAAYVVTFALYSYRLLRP